MIKDVINILLAVQKKQILICKQFKKLQVVLLEVEKKNKQLKNESEKT